ncbi:hypothetical protein [Rubrobacter marinus]|uniref:hypothetical protein n=1 Tax=Rubrobacter marinus TaxID=2653852 RepID=UPI00389A0D00
MDGKANGAAERFLAGPLGVRDADVAVVRESSSGDEYVLVRGGECDDVPVRLGSPT